MEDFGGARIWHNSLRGPVALVALTGLGQGINSSQGYLNFAEHTGLIRWCALRRVPLVLAQPPLRDWGERNLDVVADALLVAGCQAEAERVLLAGFSDGATQATRFAHAYPFVGAVLAHSCLFEEPRQALPQPILFVIGEHDRTPTRRGTPAAHAWCAEHGYQTELLIQPDSKPPPPWWLPRPLRPLRHYWDPAFNDEMISKALHWASP